MEKRRLRSQTRLNSLLWLLILLLFGAGQASGLGIDDFGASSRDLSELQVNSGPELFQERITVTGTVTEDGIGIPGVSVSIKGTTQGTITDTNGKYSIVVPDQNSVLIFSFVGMVTQELAVGSRTVIDVELKSQMIGLDEIVVTGYSIRQRSQPTGAITRVVGADIRESLVQAPDQALQGRMSGVLASSTSGQPGSGMSLLVRGRGSISASSAPIYIVDGVQVRTDFTSAIVYDNALTSINPNDIESIEVLKDASATALYGAQGANGVVLITTRQAKKGETVFTISSQYGINEQPRKLDIMDGPTWTETMIQGWVCIRRLI